MDRIISEHFRYKIALLAFILLVGIHGCSVKKNTESVLDRTVESLRSELSVIIERTVLLSASLEDAFHGASSFIAEVEKSAFIEDDQGRFYRIDKDKNLAVVASGYIPLDESVRRVVYLTEAVDPELISSVENLGSVVQSWFIGKESICRIYPAINIVEAVPPGTDVTDFAFYNLAAPESNSDRKPLWVENPYVDPAGRGWMISALSPVYQGGEFRGVAGLDVAVEKLLGRHIPSEVKNRVIVVDSRGIAVWSGGEASRVFGIPELRDHKYFEAIYKDTYRSEDYSILKSRKRRARALARSIMHEGKKELRLTYQDKKYEVQARRIPELGWTVIEVKKD